MRLVLEIMTGPQKGARREIGNDADFCVGTLPDAAWRLPIEDGDGAVWLRSDSQGYYFVAEGSVMLEDHPVPPGSPVQIGHRANLDIAGHSLRASVEYGRERDAPLLQDRHGQGPTITSILSDVAPGGTSATSALPGRAGESWMTEFGIAPSQTDASITRHAGDRPVLPDDWNARTERLNRISQMPASTSATTRAQGAETAAPAATEDDLLRAFREGAGLPAEAGGADPRAMLALAGRILRQMVDGLARTEAESRRLLIEHGLATPPTLLNHQPETDVAAVLAGPGAEGRMAARLTAVTDHQRAVALALELFLTRARSELDPTAVETRLDARGERHFMRSRAAECWEDYRRAWQGGETGPEPLSAAAFTDILCSIGAQDGEGEGTS